MEPGGDEYQRTMLAVVYTHFQMLLKQLDKQQDESS
jgi:hypothetical protein